MSKKRKVKVLKRKVACLDGPLAGRVLALTDGVTAVFKLGTWEGRYVHGKWEGRTA